MGMSADGRSDRSSLIKQDSRAGCSHEFLLAARHSGAETLLRRESDKPSVLQWAEFYADPIKSLWTW